MATNVATTGITADYSLKPSELIRLLVSMISIRQPVMVWGSPGIAKSASAQQACETIDYRHVDVRGVQLDPVDLRGIPYREGTRTRWAPPDFLPEDDGFNYCLNLEELASCTGMVQAALYQLVLDRAIGEYVLPESAAVIACGNRVNDRAVAHRMSSALASRFVHVDLEVSADDWLVWGASNGIAPETLFYITMRQEMLHDFDPRREEHAYPCPRTWEFVSRITNAQSAAGLPVNVERALYRGAVGEAAAVEYMSFLQVWRSLPHPATILNDPANAAIPTDPSTLIALCGSLYRVAEDTNIDAIVTYADRIADEAGRHEVAHYLVDSTMRAHPKLQHTSAFIKWAAGQREAA